MIKNKFCLILILSLLFIPCLAYGQMGEMGGPMGQAQVPGDALQAQWDIVLSPTAIVKLGVNNWQEAEGEIINEIMTLNPGLNSVKIADKGNKRTLILARTTENGMEEIAIDTDPQTFASGEINTAKPIDEFDMNSWLQTSSQSNINRVTSVLRDEQTFWKISAISQASAASRIAQQDQDKPAATTSPKPEQETPGGGWLSNVLAHSTLVSNFRKGGSVMYFILLCSIGGLYISIERGYELRRKHLIPPHFLEGVLTKLPDRCTSREEHETVLQDLIKYCEDHDKPIARTLKAGLFVFNQGILGVKSAIISANHHESAILGKSLGLLDVFANIAPLLGLLGTVLGMIKAFEMISIGGTGRPEVVASGISEALITTAGGLLVGIPLLVLFHYLEGKIEATMIEVEEFSLDVVERLIRATKELED